MSWITTALAELWTIVSGCVTFMTGNELLQIFLVAGLVVIGFRIFRSAKKAARK